MLTVSIGQGIRSLQKHLHGLKQLNFAAACQPFCDTYTIEQLHGVIRDIACRDTKVKHFDNVFVFELSDSPRFSLKPLP